MPTEPNDIPSRLASLVAEMEETTGSEPNDIFKPQQDIVQLRDQVRELGELLRGRPAGNFADGLNWTVANVARRVFYGERPGLIHPNSPFHTAVVNVADRIARLDQVWDAYASNFANVAGHIRGLDPIPSDPGFRTAALSFADRIARLDKDLTAYAQAEVRLAGAFNGLHREIVNLSEKLGDAFPVGIGDENRYNFAGDGKYSTLAEWVHGKAGLGRRAAGRAGVLFAVAIGAYSAVEAARELARGKSFMAAMQNVTDPITSRVVQGLTIPSAAASDAAHSILEKTGVIQPARIATGTPAGQVGVPAARGLPADGTQAARTVVV